MPSAHFTSVFVLFTTAAVSQLTGASAGSGTQYGLPCKMLISLFVQGYVERKGCGSFCFMFCVHTAFSFMVEFSKRESAALM